MWLFLSLFYGSKYNACFTPDPASQHHGAGKDGKRSWGHPWQIGPGMGLEVEGGPGWGGRWMREERGVHMKCGPCPGAPPLETICSCWTGADRWHCYWPWLLAFGFAACCALLSLSLLFLSPLVPIYPTICFVFPNNAERERDVIFYLRFV